MSPVIKELNDSKLWDNFVLNLPYHSILQSWAWGEFERSIGSWFKNYAVFKDSIPIMLLPVKKISARRGSFLQLRHGPIADWKNIDKEILLEVFKWLKTLALSEGVWAVRFQTYWPEHEKLNILFKALGALKGTNHEIDGERSVQVDLTRPEEEIFRSFRMSTRQRIKQADKLGVIVEILNDSSKFNIFAKIYTDTVKRNKWRATSIDYIRKQYEFLSSKGYSKMFIAYYRNEPIAASIFTFFGDIVIYHHSGTLSQYRKIPAAYKIQWELIKYAKQEGYKVYDLLGTCSRDNKKHPWYGVSIFKWGFSDNEVKFMHAYDIVVNPLWHLTRLYESVETRLRYKE